MNKFAVPFAGRSLVHPGGYDSIDASAMLITTEGNVSIPILVGEAEAGVTGKIKWFDDPEAAKIYLRGGELLYAVQMMMSPIPEGGGGASIVGVLVTNATTQAQIASGGLTVISKEHGAGGNRIQVKLEDGTLAGTKKFTAYRWDIDEIETYDNLGAICRLEYTGASNYAAVTIESVLVEGVPVPGFLKTWVGADEATAVVDITLDLTNDKYSTIDSIVRYFNSISGYSASYTNYDSSSIQSSDLDLLATKTSIKGGYQLKGMSADFDSRVNKYSDLISVSVTGTLTNFDFAYLSGGSIGTSPASWSTYFSTIKTQFSNMLVVLSSSITIQSEAMAHVLQMETRNQKQVMFTGGGRGESKDQVIQRAASFNSSRVVVGYPGIYHSVFQGGKVSLPAYMTGALIAGRVAGVEATEPVTFDYLNVIGLENDLISGDPDIDELISGGVATLEKVQSGGIRIVQGITTYTSANNVLYREISVRRGADILSEKMRKTMEDTFVGKKGIVGIVSAVKSKAIEVLDEAVRKGDILGYGNITVKQVGVVVYIDYQVAPTEPVNFVLVTTHFVPEILTAA